MFSEDCIPVWNNIIFTCEKHGVWGKKCRPGMQLVSLKESQRGTRSGAGGRSGAELAKHLRSAEPGDTAGQRRRRRAGGTAAGQVGPLQPPCSPPLLSRRRTRPENPFQAAGLGRGGALTSPPRPPAPQLSQEGGSRERGSDPPQLPAATLKLGGLLPGQVRTNLASLRPSL